VPERRRHLSKSASWLNFARPYGLDVASASITHAAHKDVLRIERSERSHTNDGWTRQAMVSTLTIRDLDEMMARYASYEDLTELIRHRSTSPRDTLKELYGRICFSVLCATSTTLPATMHFETAKMVRRGSRQILECDRRGRALPIYNDHNYGHEIVLRPNK
jgi:hypothetical protein